MNNNWNMLGSQQEQANQLGIEIFGNLAGLGASYAPWPTHPRDKLIQWAYPKGNSPTTGYVKDCSPYMNISGLYWRFIGISKHQDEEKWWPEEAE
jgi:hypothetical protein